MNLLPDSRSRQSTVPRISVDNPGTSNHTALSHEEATHNNERKDPKASCLTQNLQKVASHRLAEIRPKDRSNIRDSIPDDENYEPTEDSSKAGSHNDGSWRGNIRVRTFFTQMERSIVSTHGPDNAQERHEDG